MSDLPKAPEIPFEIIWRNEKNPEKMYRISEPEAREFLRLREQLAVAKEALEYMAQFNPLFPDKNVHNDMIHRARETLEKMK